MIIGFPVDATCSDERQIHDLGRGDLVGRNVEVLEKLDGRRVEWAGEAEHPVLPGSVEHRSVPLPGRVSLLVELVEAGVAPQLRDRPEIRNAGASTSMVIVSAVYVCSFSAWAPAAAAASTIVEARSSEPPWLPDISAMINGSTSRADGRSPIRIWPWRWHVDIIGSLRAFRGASGHRFLTCVGRDVARRWGSTEIVRPSTFSILRLALDEPVATVHHAHG